MNKRILSILLSLILVASLLVMAVPVSAKSETLKVTADKTEAKPGDTITFTVTSGPFKELGGFQTQIDLPAGLTIVRDSVTSQFTKNDFDGSNGADLDYDSLMVLMYGSESHDSDTDVDLFSFQATVDDDATGTLTVGFVQDETFFNDSTYDIEWVPALISTDITITGDQPTEAPETEAPATEAEATEAEATEAPATEAEATEAPAKELTFVEEVPATATEPGVKEHYEDENGNKFADITGNIPVTDEDLYIAPLGEATEAEATEAPATEAPATEAPVTEAPATEAPATEAPATEAEVTEAPATEAEVTEAPATEAEVTEAATEAATVATADEAATSDEAATEAATDKASNDQATPTQAPTKTATSPKTGDSTHMYLWMLIMLASLAGACAVLYTAKRKGIFTK